MGVIYILARIEYGTYNANAMLDLDNPTSLGGNIYNREAILSLRDLAPTENSETLIQNTPDYESSEYPLDDNRESIVSFRDPAPTGNSNTENKQRARPKPAFDKANIREDLNVNDAHPSITRTILSGGECYETWLYYRVCIGTTHLCCVLD
ncbi:hypothetical protein GJ496_012058 [Pomphorhynchus laevis]|nr:hypothetical protein GJ496_012058 [Pomphorhynchus laevis]